MLLGVDARLLLEKLAEFSHPESAVGFGVG